MPQWGRVSRAVFQVRQTYHYSYSGPVTDLRQRLVMVPPACHNDQRLLDYHLAVRGATGEYDVSWQTDRFGNRVCAVRAGRVDAAVEFEASFRVERGSQGDIGARAWPPRDVRRALLEETALTAADERLRGIASGIAAQAASPQERAQRAADWAAGAIAYRVGVTGVQTPAAMALHLGQGVCQDYAHILLSVLRLLGVPARYVSGHLLGEGVPHAWVEALLRGAGKAPDAEIVAYDPTHGRRAGLNYITVAVGRDFADVSPTSGFFSGQASGRLSATKRADVVDFVYAGSGPPHGRDGGGRNAGKGGPGA